MLGNDWGDLVHPDDLARVAETWATSIATLAPFDTEFRLRSAGGGWFNVIARALPYRGLPSDQHPDGPVLGWVGAVTDIDRVKRLEADLREAAEAKDVLLHEVNHRVKNSLQLVTSLIALQIGQTHDAHARTVLSEARQRIGVVASLHQRLYSTSLHDRVAFGPYLSRLAGDTIASVAAATIALRIEVADDVVLKLDQAVPLALIIGEVLTNAVKYAFPGGRAGTIAIAALREADGALAIEIADDGVGLTTPGAGAGSGGLGTRIVAALARQIRASTELTSEGTGTRFRIVVPPERNEHVEAA